MFMGINNHAPFRYYDALLKGDSLKKSKGPVMFTLKIRLSYLSGLVCLPLPGASVSAFVAFLMALACLWPAGVRAATKTFNVASGDFTANGSWNPAAAPVAGDAVVITNTGTATLNGGTVSDLGALSVGYGGGNGTMIQTGNASLSVTNFAVGGPLSTRLGTYTLAGGSLTTYGATFIASNGPAIFTVSNGASFVATNLFIGSRSDATGWPNAVGTKVFFGGEGAVSTIAYTNGARFGMGYSTLTVSNATINGKCTEAYFMNSSTGSVYSGTWNLGGQLRLATGGGNVLQIGAGGVVSCLGAFLGYGSANNMLAITNGGKLFNSASIFSFGTSASANSNTLEVTGEGSLYDGGGQQLRAAENAGNVGNAVRVSQGGAVTNVSTLHVGYANAVTNNSAQITSGGLVEVTTGVTVGGTSAASTSVSNTLTVSSGGILQFTKNNPTITIYNAAGGNAIVMDNGTLSYRNVLSVNITNNVNTANTDVYKFRWLGNDNGFRLNNSTGTWSTSSTYIFANNLGSAHYARLEMVSGATAFTGKGIQLDGANGGSLLLSDTTASITGGVELVGQVPVTVATDSSLTGVISGSGSLVKRGAGALTLNSTNSYAGATIVSNGTLKVMNDNALSQSTDVTIGSGAKLDVPGGVTVTVHSLTLTNKLMQAGIYTKAMLGETVFPGDGTLIIVWPPLRGTLISIF